MFSGTKIALAATAVSAAALVCAPAAAAERIETCPSGQTAVATDDTSCAFADSLRAAYYSQPGMTVIAWSPVTELFYTMQCEYGWRTSSFGEAKRCVGVNAFGAVLIVYID